MPHFPMNKRIEAAVYGRVQGVSFRYYTRREAERLKLTGWVVNMSDGSVHLVAEGPEDALKTLINFLHVGSPHAVVDKVDIKWAGPTNEFKRFSVRWR